jgi:hypothetical protein
VRGVLDAEDEIEHGAGSAGWKLVAAPGHVLVGADEHRVGAVQSADLGVEEVDDGEGEAAIGRLSTSTSAGGLAAGK